MTKEINAINVGFGYRGHEFDFQGLFNKLKRLKMANCT